MSASELEVVAPGALKLAQEGASLDKIMEEMLAETRPVPSRAEEAPQLPAPVTGLSDAARLALETLPKVFGKVNLNSRKPMTEEELTILGQEDMSLRIVLGDLERRHELIKEIIRIHADALAEQENKVVPREVTGTNPETGVREVIVPATPRDDKGHYLHVLRPRESHRVHIPGTPKDWSLEFHGNGIEYDLPALARMLAEKEITPAEFRAMTRPVIDEQRISAFLTAKPARALQILKRITRRKTPSNYLYIRTQK